MVAELTFPGPLVIPMRSRRYPCPTLALYRKARLPVKKGVDMVESGEVCRKPLQLDVPIGKPEGSEGSARAGGDFFGRLIHASVRNDLLITGENEHAWRRCGRPDRQTTKWSSLEAGRRRGRVEDVTAGLIYDYDSTGVESLLSKPVRCLAAGAARSWDTGARWRSGLDRSVSSQPWALFSRRLTGRQATPPAASATGNPAHAIPGCLEPWHAAKENRNVQALSRCQVSDRSVTGAVDAAGDANVAALALRWGGGVPDDAMAVLGGHIERQPFDRAAI